MPEDACRQTNARAPGGADALDTRTIDALDDALLELADEAADAGYRHENVQRQIETAESELKMLTLVKEEETEDDLLAGEEEKFDPVADALHREKRKKVIDELADLKKVSKPQLRLVKSDACGGA